MPGPEQDSVYRLIVEGFRSLGAADAHAIRRAVIFRQRNLVGQRFLCGDLQAVRLAGEDVVRFYDERGKLLLSLDANSANDKKAA